MHPSLDSFEKTTKENIQEWLDGPYEEEDKKAILRLLSENPKELANAFFQQLSFGTGGIRALMGVGCNRLNPTTIRFATQGVANYLKKIYPKEKLKVLIGYDNRNHSASFAEESARVLAANGLHVFLLKELRPTPLISFGCRFLHCHAAIMITASHNPPEYNGFKVYGRDGGQVIPPHDQGIIQEAGKIRSPKDVLIAPLSHPLIERVLEKIDLAYLALLPSLNFFPEQNQKEGKQLSIIYTNLHGAGITLLPKALSEWGFSNLSLVEKQKEINGNFPYAPKPNPEEKEALKLGLALMEEKKADLLMATDPDADRIAVACNHQGKAVIFSGNELACLLLHHVATSLKEKKKFPKDAAFIKTIVTSELFKAIATDFHSPCFDVLTGFKYISELMEKWEVTKEHTFVFGAEESYGYLANTFVRDKDAISTGCLIAQMALMAKLQKKTLFDLLMDLYKKYGIYREESFSVSFPEGKEGMKKMENLMALLRKDPPSVFGNCELVLLEDFLLGKAKNFMEKKEYSLSLPKSNVLRFWLDDQSKLVIRPSGTEPKIKIYAGVVEKNTSSMEKALLVCNERVHALLRAAQKVLS